LWPITGPCLARPTADGIDIGISPAHWALREAAESANAILKGQFVDVAWGFFRVFGLEKITVLLAFTLVGYNVWRHRSFIRGSRFADKGPDPPTRSS
jgi:hypothetical protein